MILLIKILHIFWFQNLHQKVFRSLDPELAESINLSTWPKPNNEIRNKILEEEFDILFKSVSLTFAARQKAKIKRRWPLKTVVMVGNEKTIKALSNHELLFLELINIKSIKYNQMIPDFLKGENWISTSEDELSAFINIKRDDALLGEGLMRDLARRVQSLRKDMGFVPTEFLNSVHIAGLNKDNVKLLVPYMEEMADLVRARKIYLHKNQTELDVNWKEAKLDGKKILIELQ